MLSEKQLRKLVLIFLGFALAPRIAYAHEVAWTVGWK